MGIFGEFFGNSLGIHWEFFRNSLEIVTKVSWLCLFTKSIVSYLGRFGFLSRFCLKAEGQEFRSLEVRASISHLKIEKKNQNGWLKKSAFFKIANSQKFFVKISWIGPWVRRIDWCKGRWCGSNYMVVRLSDISSKMA